MPGFIIVLVLIACVFLFFGCGKKENFASNLFAGKSEQNKKLSRKLLESRLEKLSVTPAPSKHVGATCYKISMNFKRAEFVCPVCGEKTIYPEKTVTAMFINMQLAQMRRDIKKLKGLDIKLDETQFCKKCSPSVKHPELFLVINFSDAEPSKVKISYPSQITILKAFLEGKTSYKDAVDIEVPLRQNLPIIKELLGVK